ncbi:MAG: SIMPL domain-containing protein [Lachnospiraceae bacterium]|nr:SIMPL domain-containing protein [Lachnospiraceae bacterium]
MNENQENNSAPKKSGGVEVVKTIILGICIVASCVAIAFGLSMFRSGGEHSIGATGSASVDFESDLIKWGGQFKTHADTSKIAYKQIKKDADIVRKYLENNGILPEELVFSSIDITERTKDVYDEEGNYKGYVPDGYDLSQTVTIVSENIDGVELISRDISSLLDSGVEFTSWSPEYYYTKLDDLKLDLIDQASENARERIDIIAANSDAKLGMLKNSSLGVFQITARNSGTGDYSYDGAFNISSREKTATITVRLEYDLKLF